MFLFCSFVEFLNVYKHTHARTQERTHLVPLPHAKGAEVARLAGAGDDVHGELDGRAQLCDPHLPWAGLRQARSLVVY